MEHNLKFNKKLRKIFEKDYGKLEYPRYENYDAIEVPFVECIPSDYDGVMGVPITYMDKYNPEQFEILGTSDNGIVPDEYKTTPGLSQKFVDDYYRAGGKGAYKEGNPTAGIYKNNIARSASFLCLQPNLLRVRAKEQSRCELERAPVDLSKVWGNPRPGLQCCKKHFKRRTTTTGITFPG